MRQCKTFASVNRAVIKNWDSIKLWCSMLLITKLCSMKSVKMRETMPNLRTLWTEYWQPKWLTIDCLVQAITSSHKAWDSTKELHCEFIHIFMTENDTWNQTIFTFLIILSICPSARLNSNLCYNLKFTNLLMRSFID